MTMILPKPQGVLSGRLRVLELFDRLDGLADLVSGDNVKLLVELLGILGDFRDAATIAQKQLVVARALELVGPRTKTDLDDGVALALRALAEDADWNAWLEKQLEHVDNAEGDDDLDLPEGALSIVVTDAHLPSSSVETITQLPRPVTAAGFAEWVPFILQAIRLLQELFDNEG